MACHDIQKIIKITVMCNKKRKCSDDSHSSAKLQKKKCYVPFFHTPVTLRLLCLIFLMHVATMHRLNYSGQESKNTLSSLWIWHTCDLEIRPWSSNLVWIARPLAGLLSFKAWRTSLKQCPPKSQHLTFVTPENMSIISLNVQKWKIVVYSLCTWLTLQSHKVPT